jgi:hypothetical protein
MGIVYTGITALNTAAINELSAALKAQADTLEAYVASHP